MLKRKKEKKTGRSEGGKERKKEEERILTIASKLDGEGPMAAEGKFQKNVKLN